VKRLAKRIDISISLALIVIAGIMIHTSRSFPGAQGADVGASFFPVILSSVLILLSVLLMVTSMKKKTVESRSEEKSEWKKVLLGMTCTFFYFVLLIYLGYVIATPIFLAAMMWMFNYRRLIHVVFWSLLITGLIYVCFALLLQVPLPDGVLGS
jgi:putative tricarboxylic transport membrane protein